MAVPLVQTGKVLEENKIHDATINDLQLSADGSHFVTASNDRTAKLVDTVTLEELKVYQTDRNVNSASLSPIYDHVCLPWPAPAFATCSMLAFKLYLRLLFFVSLCGDQQH